MKKQTYFFVPSRRHVSGATLLEVMISVLLLTFGILALMTAQLRSVASLGEAENRSIISQAAEALAEGMQMNAIISKPGALKVYRRRYTNYVPKSKPLIPGDAGAAPAALTGDGITKAALAAKHIEEFEYILNKELQNVSVLGYAICQDKQNPDEPTLSDAGTLNSNCDPKNTETDTNVIKVAWRMGNGTNNNQDSTTYTYMLEVGN